MSEEEKMRNSICRILKEKGEIEIQTIDKNGRTNLWFSIAIVNMEIEVSEAKHHKPSSVLKTNRFIRKEKFVRVSKKYDAWRKGTEKHSEIKKDCHNVSYIFGIVNYLKDKGW